MLSNLPVSFQLSSYGRLCAFLVSPFLGLAMVDNQADLQLMYRLNFIEPVH